MSIYQFLDILQKDDIENQANDDDDNLKEILDMGVLR